MGEIQRYNLISTNKRGVYLGHPFFGGEFGAVPPDHQE